MIQYIIKLIIRNQLNRINANGEGQFYDILCNKYNNGNKFEKINSCTLNKKDYL